MTYIAPMTRDCAQRTTAAGEAAADRGADSGDEAAAAGGGVNAGAHAAGAAMETDEGAEAEGGGAREARAPAKTTPRRESASAPAPPSRKRPPPTWHWHTRRRRARYGRNSRTCDVAQRRPAEAQAEKAWRAHSRCAGPAESCSIRRRAGCDERRCEYVRRGDGRLMTTRGWWGERPWNGAVSSVSR